MSGMREEGKAMRDKAVSMAMKRKEEYLGARVPKELRERVIQQAREMGIPVSILIRNTLEEAFKGKDIDSGAMLLSARCSENKKIDSEKFTSVLGWETIELSRAFHCSGCGATLQQGMRVNIGLGTIQPLVVCATCKESLK